MGAFGALGAAAGGFEQAHQTDLQRQFLSEQGSRQAGLDIFKTVLTDPNQPDAIRNAALEGYMGIVNTPYGKFKLEKATAPLQQLLAQHRAAQLAGQNAPPPPPFQAQIPGMQAQGSAPQITPGQPIPLPPGIAGPPQQGPPQMTGGGSLNIPAMTTRVQGPPPPPPQGSFLAGVPQIAQNAATLAGAPILGQAGAREQVLSQIPGMREESPLTQGALSLGMSPAFLSRTTGAQGGGFAGQLRAMGQDVPMNIPDNQWVNFQPRAGGTQYVPGKAPGEVSGGNGTMLTSTEAAAQREQNRQAIDFPFWQRKFGQQAALRMQLQDRAFSYALTQHDYTRLDQIYADQFKDYAQRDQSLSLMQKLRDQAMSGKGPANQQAMVALLGQHIGMTTPVGGRVSRASYEEAEQSASKVGLAIAKFFHYDKDTDQYVFDGWKGGINLTPDQMNNMVKLAQDRVDTSRNTLNYYNGAMREGGYQPPALGAIGGGPPSASGGKPRGGGPPKPPAQSGPQVGAIEDGYRFKGGNPADKNNWELAH